MRYLVTFLRVCGLVLIAFIGCFGGGEEEGCESYELPPLCLFPPCSEPDPCEGVLCPPDDNECTREFCSGGSCTSEPVTNGRSCTYDGLSGVCVAGVCGENLCEDVVCDDGDACTEGTCDYVDGTCDFTPVVCNDDNPCTEDTCDPADGCDFTTLVEDGTRCGSEMWMWMCIAGECVRGECWTPDDCDDGNDCTEDACSVGVCENPQVKDGTPCAGGACSAGACELTGSVLPCTEQGIRNAIAAGGGPYTFDCGGPQTVITGATIRIDNSVILDGEGNLTIDANEAHRVFLVFIDVTAELRGMTVTGGLTNNGGGGIYNGGTLTLTNSTVSGNTAEFRSGGYQGGGIYNGGTLTLTNSTVSGNTGWSGGGILNSGTLTLMNSTVSGNTAEFGGGGIRNWGSATLTHSTVSGNTAEVDGGGIYNSNSGPGTLTLTNTTVSGNTADLGGGIYNSSFATVALTNSTVSGNTAEQVGGGVSNHGTMTLTNTTVSGNTAEVSGGIHSYGPLTLTNSLVDGDCEGFPQAAPDITSNGYNIESPGNTCGFDQEGDQVNVTEAQLNLGPLADNDGPTMTHKPGDGEFGEDSVAIDKIPVAVCEVTTDQRGEPRPAGAESKCDVGSVEVQP